MTRGRPWAESLLVFLFHALVTVAFTWPLASAPGRLTIPADDTYGNAWALAWVVHQATTDPLRLFEANIYYPHERSLSYTEALLPQALMAAPVLLMGGSPMLAHNLVLLLTFPLSGLGAYLLARELSGSRTGAFLAGLGYAFCAYRFFHLVHVQSLSAQWLPFALLYARRAAVTGAKRHGMLAALFALLQALSSGYYAILVAVALGLNLLWHALRRGDRRALARLTGSLAVAGALALAVFLVYRGERGLARTRDDARTWSAAWSSYLDPGPHAGAPHLAALRQRFATREPLYPGLVIAGLAAAGLVVARREEAARLAALLTATGVLLSLGPDMRLGPWTAPGPFDLLRQLPGADMLRAPSRLGVLALLGMGVLAAIGWARLAGGRRGGALVAGALVVATLVELRPAGLWWRPAEPPPPSARWLAEAPRGPVLELPWDHETMERGGVYVYWSTLHWQPMVNGWGGYQPQDCFGLGVIGRLWPSPYTARVFRAAGIRYVVVHAERVRPAQRRRMGTGELPEGVRTAAIIGPDWIYEIGPEDRTAAIRTGRTP